MKSGWNFVAVVVIGLLPVSSVSAAAQPDRLTLSDAEMVVQVNVRQMLQAPLIRKHALGPFKTLLEHNAETCQLLRAAGLDPLQDIDTISLSMSGHPLSGGKLLVVVRGRLAPDKVRTTAENYAKKYPDRLKSFSEDGLPMWEIHWDNFHFYAAFADNQTLVMTTAKEDTSAAVRRPGQTPPRLNKAMQTALAHLKGSENIWLALTVTDGVRQLFKGDDAFKELATSLQSITGALELNENAQLKLVVHTNSPQAATQIKRKLDDLMPLLAFLSAGKDPNSQIAKEAIDSIQLKTETNDVSIRLHVTDAQIDKVYKKDR